MKIIALKNVHNNFIKTTHVWFAHFTLKTIYVMNRNQNRVSTYISKIIWLNYVQNHAIISNKI